MNWELTWKIIFIFILCAFAVLAVVTTILGAKDVKNLLEDLNKDSAEEDEGGDGH